MNLRKCPKCGSTEIEKKYGAEIDPSDPSTYEVVERESKWGDENWEIVCKNCGYVFEWDLEMVGGRG